MKNTSFIKQAISNFTSKSTSEKIMFISALLILLTSTYMNDIDNITQSTIIPYPSTTIRIINGFFTILWLINFFLKKTYPIQVAILYIEGIVTLLIDFKVLGTFLYSAVFVVLFCNKFFIKNTGKKLLFLCSSWFLAVFSLIPFGLDRFIFTMLITFFFSGFYFHIYKLLESKLSIFIPVKADKTKTIQLPNRGCELNLSDYDLSERQIKILKEYVSQKSSYKEIAEKFFYSISTVKKDMTTIFSIFGVKNKNDLYFLLSQYKIL